MSFILCSLVKLFPKDIGYKMKLPLTWVDYIPVICWNNFRIPSVIDYQLEWYDKIMLLKAVSGHREIKLIWKLLLHWEPIIGPKGTWRLLKESYHQLSYSPLYRGCYTTAWPCTVCWIVWSWHINCVDIQQPLSDSIWGVQHRKECVHVTVNLLKSLWRGRS